MRKWRRPWQLPLPLLRILLLACALALAVSSVFAVVIGFPDVFWPTSTAGQLAGLALFLAGLAGGLAGLGGLLGLRRPLADRAWWSGWNRYRAAGKTGQIACVFGGAAAGTYADLVITAYAYRFHPGQAIAFGILAFFCAALAGVLLPAVWIARTGISGSLKSLAALGGALTLVAQFWYGGVYIPKNTQVGITYSLTLGPVVRSGHDDLATVQVSLKNESSLPAVILGSMAIVRGLSAGSFGDSMSPQEAVRGGRVLTVQSLIANNAVIFPGVTYARNVVVQVPPSGVAALQAEVMVDYARETRLTPGPSHAQVSPVTVPECRRSDTMTWVSAIQEGRLRTFTTGTLYLYSSWCNQPGHFSIDETIGTSSSPEPAAVETALQDHYGRVKNNRYEIFVLDPAMTAPPSRPAGS
jgi:hypothetical protein